MSLRWLAKSALATVASRRFYLFVNSRSAARDIATRRRWAPEIEHLPRFVRPGDVAVDVGGGHGLYTYHLSRLVGSQGRVHTFEPMPPNLQILRYTVRCHELTNVVIHAQACGEARKRAQFAMPVSHRVLGMGGARQGGQGLSFECDIVRLDEALTLPVHFVKVDVEGAELLVFRGAEKLLRRCRPVLLFEAGGATADFGYRQQAVFDYLATLGYRFLSGGFTGKALEPRERFTDVEDYFGVPEHYSSIG